MKATVNVLRLLAALAGMAWFCGVASVSAAQSVAPFGFTIGAFSYEQTLNRLSELEWPFTEYEKKQFKTVPPNSARRGENTFLRVTPSRMEGIKGILIFFGPDQHLQALLINLEPHLFAATMADLDAKYRMVKKKFDGESFSSDHPYILYEKDGINIELQMFSPHRVRLLYTEKVMWENYREFLQKDYEPFRNKHHREAWMKDL